MQLAVLALVAVALTFTRLYQGRRHWGQTPRTGNGQQVEDWATTISARTLDGKLSAAVRQNAPVPETIRSGRPTYLFGTWDRCQRTFGLRTAGFLTSTSQFVAGQEGLFLVIF